MPLEDDFCDIMKKARTGRGWSLAAVAQAAGLDERELATLERGARRPTSSELESLAKALGLRADALADVALRGWTPSSAASGIEGVQTVHGEIGGYAVKGYVLYDDTESREAVLIDTGYNPAVGLQFIEQRGLRLVGICLTHGHADHAGGLERILRKWRVPVYLGEGDLSLLPWRPPSDLLKLVSASQDGRLISVGRFAVRFMITPGHTPGGICYRVEQHPRPLCFVGDTLFAGSIGRANPPSLYPAHLESVRGRVLMLPEQTVLLPGHGPATTVREELAHNPFAVPPIAG